MRTIPLAPVLLLVALLAPSPACAEDLAARGRAADRDVVAALEAVAKWCQARRLFGKRDETYELVLEFAPDHERARRQLKFARAAGGAWEQDPGYRRPRNWNPKLAVEYDRRLGEAFGAYRDALLLVVGSARTSPELTWAASTALRLRSRLPQDAQVVAAHRQALLRHLLLLQQAELPVELEAVSAQLLKYFPKDPEVRRALGEVEYEGRWVTPSTARAARSRARYREVARAAHGGVPRPAAGSLSADERGTGLPWKGPFETAHVRVLGTVTEASLEQIASSCEAAAAFFQSVLRHEAVRAPRFTFYLFARREDWTSFVEYFPAIDPGRKEEARTTRQSGYGIAGAVYAVLPVHSPEAERDLCVDVTFQHLLQMTFNPLPRKPEERGEWRRLPGWVRTGLSDYLTYRLIGTRILTTVAGEYGRPLTDPGARVPDKDTAWLREARAILERDGARGTHLMLGKTLGAFGRDDAVTSFAVASWLLEGRPEAAPALLAGLGRRGAIKDVLLEVTGLTIEALHVELLRWLEEMSAAG